jgi:histidyl-tRNA synthetase
MDKADKLSTDALSEQMKDIGLSSQVVQELIASLQITDVSAFSELFARSSVKTTIGTEGVADLLRLQELLGHYGLREWTQFDASVVRGLAYYTGVVFEAFDRAGALRAICGGGRYDRLLQSMFRADRSVPAVGFGFGDAVVEELLRLKGLLPVALMEKPHFDVVLYFMDPQLRAQATELATTMRHRGVSVRMITEDRWKPKAAFAHGDKMGARYLVMLAMSEHKRGEAVLKDLRARSQCTFQYSNIDAEIDKILETTVSGL